MSNDSVNSSSSSSNRACNWRCNFGILGLGLCLASAVGLLLVSNYSYDVNINLVGKSLLLLSIPGSAASSIGLFQRHRNYALLGLVIGIVVLCYLPTVFLHDV